MIGPLLLPKTNNIFGRKSKPRSHWLYVTGLAETISKACLQFKDIDGTMMLELRIGGAGKGSQSVFPGSVHESGETAGLTAIAVLLDAIARSLHPVGDFFVPRGGGDGLQH